MRISELLIAKNLLSVVDVERAIDRQRAEGGPLLDNIMGLELVSIADIDEVLSHAPDAPGSIKSTGLTPNFLTGLLAKTIYSYKTESIAELREVLKLPAPVIAELLRDGSEQKLFEEYVGGYSGSGNDTNYRLSIHGKALAEEEMNKSRYVGPAPVPLSDYHAQVFKQAIGGEFVNSERVEAAFAHLVISPAFLRRLGPSLNSGKSILMYGPPGNGKSTISEQIGEVYESVIFVPHAIEVGGEIITIYDTSIHERIATPNIKAGVADARREEIDRRWVPCRRPMVMTGGELTLDMLDLRFNEVAKFYEAPLHVKAQGGVFIVDDFGRQLVKPEELLNRWIIPLERRVDFLQLHTGKQFEIPFDQLTIFSTNLEPDDLMDPAFLRRIPYKIEVLGPSEAEFTDIFMRVCKGREIICTTEDVSRVIEILTNVEGFSDLACYQAKFIVDQVVDACRYERETTNFDPVIVENAVANIYAKSSAPSFTMAKGVGGASAAADA